MKKKSFLVILTSLTFIGALLLMVWASTMLQEALLAATQESPATTVTLEAQFVALHLP